MRLRVGVSSLQSLLALSVNRTSKGAAAISGFGGVLFFFLSSSLFHIAASVEFGSDDRSRFVSFRVENKPGVQARCVHLAQLCRLTFSRV